MAGEYQKKGVNEIKMHQAELDTSGARPLPIALYEDGLVRGGTEAERVEVVDVTYLPLESTAVERTG